LRTVLGAVVAIAMLSQSALAKERHDPPIYLADAQRSATVLRDIDVEAPQRDIETMVDLGRIAPNAGGGGLIGAIIIESSDDRRKRMTASQAAIADATAAPIRTQVRSIDVEALARTTTRSAFAAVPWFNLRPVTAQPAAAQAGQVALVSYRYALSPDFSQVRILATVALRPYSPGSALNPLLRMRLLSIVQLRTPSYEPRENATRWAADEGNLIKTAFKNGFAKFGDLIPYALSLDAAQARAIVAKGREKAFAAGFYGELIARGPSPGDVLIWSDGPVSVQTLP
jgi:hypothetical protein